MSLTLEKRIVLLLACARALFQTSSVLTVTISGIVGCSLASHGGLATLAGAIRLRYRDTTPRPKP